MPDGLERQPEWTAQQEDDFSAWLNDGRSVTIRESTADERRERFPPIVAGGKRIPVPRYVVINPTSGNIYTVFGLPQGGRSKAEAVFWAERLASKNGFPYIAPEGWDEIEGALPANR